MQDYIQEALGITKYEAIKEMAEATGNADKYIIKKEKNKKENKENSFPLSPKEIEIIGLSNFGSINNIVNFSYEEIDDEKYYSKKVADGYEVYERGATRWTLRDLYDEDKELFYEMVRNKIKERWNKTIAYLMIFSKIPTPFATNVCNILIDMHYQLKELSLRFKKINAST